MIIERHFDEELKDFNAMLLKMGATVENSIYISIEALKKQDMALAREVIDKDHIIDQLELAIEDKALEILATKQPWAVDLRFVTTGMRINSELERIADLAVNISYRVIEMGGEPLLKPLIDVPKLTDMARKMVHDAIDSFVQRDEELAKKVILMDSEADELRNLINDELVNDYLVKDGSTAPRAIPLILVSRHLERMCDHATNIAEDVIFMVQAKTVKHHLDELEEQKENGEDL